MKPHERRLQTFVPPEILRTLKMRAVQSDTTIKALVREMVIEHCNHELRTPQKENH